MKHRVAFVVLAVVALSACQSADRVSSDSPVPGRQRASAGAVGVSVGLFSQAVAMLELEAESPHPIIRANAIESLHAAPEVLPPYVMRGLADENRGVRFVAAMTLGKFRFADLAHLAEPLLADDSASVQAAAIYALHRCGRNPDLNPLASMIRSEDPEVRANAAVVLGQLGNPSAIPLIEQALGQGMSLENPARAKVVDLQLAEALFRLGQDEQVHSIRAAMFAPAEAQELAALACQMLGRIEDQGAIAGLRRLAGAEGDERRPAEVRLAALGALARMGEPIEASWVSDFTRFESPWVRAQAASTLGEIGGAASEQMLNSMLDDASPLVRVAASGAIARMGRNNSNQP